MSKNRGYPCVLPTAVVELLSQRNRTVTGYRFEFQQKLDDYQTSAVPVVVILDPKIKAAIIRRPGKDDEISRENVQTFAELPGLELNVHAIHTLFRFK